MEQEPDENTVSIVYAHTDEHIVNMHRFLVAVAGPTLPFPIDARKSVEEIWRVTKHDIALMALRGNRLVGTLGLLRPDFWWGNGGYLANRWFFTLPNEGAGVPLLREARAIAIASGLELHIIAEAKGKIVILNKSWRRNGYQARPVLSLDPITQYKQTSAVKGARMS
jgi:hypothetical protein